MTYAAVADLAMVLPLPVAPNPPEDAVRFINLERYPTFFDEMRSGFPVNEVHSRSRSVALYSFSAPELRVHDVGKFEASFVPRIDDFDRLNERFHIPRDVWDTLPLYRDYGFAVFKLKGRRLRRIPGFLRRLFGGGSSNGQAEPYQVHPMAFEFPMRTQICCTSRPCMCMTGRFIRTRCSTICSTARPVRRWTCIFRVGKSHSGRHRSS